MYASKSIQCFIFDSYYSIQWGCRYIVTQLMDRLDAKSDEVKPTSVVTELCREGSISSTLWIRLRRVMPIAWRWTGGQTGDQRGERQRMARKKLKLKKVTRGEEKHCSENHRSGWWLTYFDSVGILGWAQRGDIILQLHHLFHHRHDARVNLITWSVQLSCGQRLKHNTPIDFST